MLPTIEHTLLIAESPCMTLPRIPWTFAYGLFAQTALTSLPTPSALDTVAIVCSTAPPCAM